MKKLSESRVKHIMWCLDLDLKLLANMLSCPVQQLSMAEAQTTAQRLREALGALLEEEETPASQPASQPANQPAKQAA